MATKISVVFNGYTTTLSYTNNMTQGEFWDQVTAFVPTTDANGYALERLKFTHSSDGDQDDFNTIIKSTDRENNMGAQNITFLDGAAYTLIGIYKGGVLASLWM